MNDGKEVHPNPTARTAGLDRYHIQGAGRLHRSLYPLYLPLILSAASSQSTVQYIPHTASLTFPATFFFLHKTPETKDPDIIPARGIHGRRNPAGRSPGGLIGCYLGQSKHNHILCDQRCKLPTLTAQGAVSPTKEALTLPRYETIYKIHLDNYTCVPKIRHILWVTQLIP